MIWREYIKGDMKLNKKSYSSTIITIFLAVIILSTFVLGVTSYYKSYRDYIGDKTGGYHFRIVNEISNNDARALKENRNIKKLGLFSSKVLDESFGSKKKTMFFKMDDNSLSTIKSWLKEGSLPDKNEIMISNDMSKEIDKTLGDKLSVNGKEYYISGIYYDITYEFDEVYNIYLNVDQDELLETEKGLSPFIWYKNIFKTYSMSEKIMENMELQDLNYNYNLMYLDRSFVFDPDDSLLQDHTYQIIVLVLFFILVMLFYFIITNLFLVQEAKSVKEYSRLKSIGATDKDIKKIIKLKAVHLSQKPIIIGIISSAVLVNILFLIINKVEKYFSTNKGIIESNLDLNFYSNIKFIVFIYILSTVIIYLGTKKPIKKLKKNSILDGLKGNISSKSYKKYDLKYTKDIEKDLSKQFYKNSKKSFKSSGFILKLGFVLMSFVMMVITYMSLEDNLNTVNKYETYNIQGKYATISPLKKSMIKDIKANGIEDIISFRNESVYLDFDEKLIDEDYLNSGGLENLEDKIDTLDEINVNIIGVEDEAFNKLVSEKGLNPKVYRGNKVLLLNTIGDRFDIPVTKIEDQKFLKDNIKKISLSEYGPVLKTKGYEFTLNIEDKIDTPLFDYPLSKNRLNAYMPKSEYVKLFNSFERIADLDQFEYIAVNSNNIEEDKETIKDISLNYFKDGDFELDSKVDRDNQIQKRNIIGNILAVFFSIFFIVVGFSNSYFAFYNLFLKRKDELILYKSIGMDETLLNNILKKEKNKILFNFIASMPIILIILAFILSQSTRAFSVIDLLLNLNYIFLIGYILIIYISISKMYNVYKKEIIE